MPERPLQPPVLRPSASLAFPLPGRPSGLPLAYPVSCPPPSLTRAAAPPFLSGGEAPPTTASMADLLARAKSALSEEWLTIIQELGAACILFQEASATSTPLVHIQHPVLRFAPSTIKRYMADWRSWAAFCAALSASPADPPPGALPDWLASRASKQGLATGPLRALSWFARIAGLPSLQTRLQVSVVRAFATASAPSERRESLPLPLSFVVWMERRVADASTHPSEALFLGFLLTAVWASLRWGDLLWTPPARLHLQLSHGAILGTAVRTKTTNRSMPFGFLVVGLSGSPSVNWGVRFFNLLRQALADTLSLQPGRVVDFLPARLGGSDSRPLLLDPCERHLAVPRLLSLLAAHWSSNCTSQPPSQFALYGAHSCKATVLSWSRQMSLDRTLRRIQGHHRLSGADRSVELYGRDDIRPMLDLQAQVINHARAGFRPLQPLARGSSVPLPDFAAQLPAALVPVLSEANVGPAHLPPAFPPCPGPVQEHDPSPVSIASLPPLEDADPSPVDSPSSASACSADSGEALDSQDDTLVSEPGAPPSDAPFAAPPRPHLEAPAVHLYVYNHRTNVIHAARPTSSADPSGVPDPLDADQLYRTACGSRTSRHGTEAVCRTLPPASSPCLHRACRAALPS